jgi:hypothetical protein
VATSSIKGNVKNHDQVISEGELRDILTVDTNFDTGSTSGIRIGDLMTGYFGVMTPPGLANIFVPPTNHHIRIALAILGKLDQQFPSLRIDYRLLANQDSVLIQSHEAMVNILDEQELDLNQKYRLRRRTHSRRDYDTENKNWPLILRWLDRGYLDQRRFELEELDMAESSSSTENFHLHTLFANYTIETPPSCIIIIAEKERIEQLLDTPIVGHKVKVQNERILQLRSAGKRGKDETMLVWNSERWAFLT